MPNDPLTAERLEELERLLRCSTMRPWIVGQTDGVARVYAKYLGAVCECGPDSGLYSNHAANMAAIAEIVNAAPALIAAAREAIRLREEVQLLDILTAERDAALKRVQEAEAATAACKDRIVSS